MNSAANWSGNTLPTTNDDVLITESAPSLSFGDGEVAIVEKSANSEIAPIRREHSSRRRRVHSFRALVVASLGLLATLAVPLVAIADPAHFWISTSNVSPPGPEAQSIGSVLGSVRYLHIWAQPMPGKTIQNFSLNLVTANQPVVEFLNDSIVVHNPLLDGKKRFQFVHDTSEGLVSVGTLPDRINNFQGFNVADNLPFVHGGITYTGIGGASCAPGDLYCDDNGPNGPAWLIASVATQTIAATGSADYFLEIGSNGIAHAGDINGSADTTVVFGAQSGPEYNASTNRGTHSLPGETSDLAVQAAPSATPMHWTSDSGQWSDAANWDLGASTAPSWTNNAFLDASLGTNAVTVAGVQQANLTTVNGGRLHISADGSLASDVTVAQGGTVSGSGWVGSNLTLDGTLSISSANSLKVSGTADVSGAALSLLGSYSQAPNTTTSLIVLEALGGIAGTFFPPVDPQLRPGLFLESITYTPPNNPRTITIQLRSENTGLLGDFNADNSVDAADYVGLRKTNATAEEFENWRTHFARSSGGGSGSSNDSVVPEPASMTLLLICICLFQLIRKETRLRPRVK